MKIVFMGTPEFAVPTLESLYEKGYNIELVITQKDRPRGRGKKVQYTPIKKKSLELGLKTYEPDNVNSKESIEKIKEIEPDFIVVAAFGQILKKDILEIPKYICLNVHASLLPKYRGAAPIHWALINGEKETGITIMEIEEGLDTGDMICKSSIPILENDDAASLHDKLSQLGGDLAVSTIERIVKGEATKTPQDHSKSSYSPMLTRETGKINWKKTGEEIKNLVRGVKPWPGAYTNYKKEIMKIHDLNIIPRIEDGEIGEIIKVNNEGLYVKAVDSIVVIKELQFPNRRKMTVQEYLAGNDIETGVILN